jgi:hypothetical protein
MAPISENTSAGNLLDEHTFLHNARANDPISGLWDGLT